MWFQQKRLESFFPVYKIHQMIKRGIEFQYVSRVCKSKQYDDEGNELHSTLV